jgi:RNA polymerase-binding transcription factor DksA
VAQKQDDAGDEGREVNLDMDTAAHEQRRSSLESERDELLERLRELDDALRRLTNGTYGTCESCKQEIGDARLAETPETRQCADCAGAEASVLTASPDVE